jgi:hypothetical protein
MFEIAWRNEPNRWIRRYMTRKDLQTSTKMLLHEPHGVCTITSERSKAHDYFRFMVVHMLYPVLMMNAGCTWDCLTD